MVDRVGAYSNLFAPTSPVARERSSVPGGVPGVSPKLSCIELICAALREADGRELKVDVLGMTGRPLVLCP